jgi:hypothetical protein
MKPKDFINFCSLSRTASSSFEHTSLSIDEISELERTKRAVKEEASKTKVDIDILHEKLIVFENLARKWNHELKDKITLILSRFHIHKNRPAFAAALMLKLVCSKEEEAKK